MSRIFHAPPRNLRTKRLRDRLMSVLLLLALSNGFCPLAVVAQKTRNAGTGI